MIDKKLKSGDKVIYSNEFDSVNSGKVLTVRCYSPSAFDGVGFVGFVEEYPGGADTAQVELVKPGEDE